MSTRKMYVIDADEAVDVKTVDADNSTEYYALSDGVGGLIEAVYIQNPERAIVWVNEEGILLNLPMNLRATMLTGQIIFGNVVVTGPIDDEGYTTAVGPKLAAFFS